MIWARGSDDESLRKEPGWVAIAHALLTHGPGESGCSPQEFWPRVAYVDGSQRTDRSISRHLRDAELNGALLARDPLRLGPGMGYVVGVSVGGESMRAGLFDANGSLTRASGPGVSSDAAEPHRLFHAAEAPPEVDQLIYAPEALLRRLGDLVRAVIDRAAADGKLLVDGCLPLLGVAVGWPTPLNRWTKLPTGSSLQDRAWRFEVGGKKPRGVDDLVAEQLGIPISHSHAINDANAVAIAAAFDRCREDAGGEAQAQLGSVILALRLGAGVGAGIAVVGSPPDALPRSRFLYTRLIEGTGGYAGELGHWQIPEADLEDVRRQSTALDPRTEEAAEFPTRRCACGNDRCLGSYASAKAFVTRMEAAGIEIPGLPPESERGRKSTIRRALLEATDAEHVAAQEDAGRLIGRSLAAPILILNPERIVLAGSFALEHVKAGIEQERRLWRHVWRLSDTPDVDVKLVHGIENSYSVARGAALATFRAQLFRRIDDGVHPRSLTIDLRPAEIRRWAQREAPLVA